MAESRAGVSVRSKALPTAFAAEARARSSFCASCLLPSNSRRRAATHSLPPLAIHNVCSPMFYYVSFLRPPTTQSFPSGSISITPQVSNDLRTEPFDGAQEIYYSWSQTANGSSRPEPYPSITAPQKLTVWRQSGAYKEMRVPLPQGLRDGQSYRLVLTAHGQGRPHIVNLAGADLGARPFPVMSMPILFSSRGRGGAAVEKQEQIERVYRIPLREGENGFLTVREQTSFDLDKVRFTLIPRRQLANCVDIWIENMG